MPVLISPRDLDFWLAACERARHVRIWPHPSGWWTARDVSTPQGERRFHKLTVEHSEDGVKVSCSCRGYYYRQCCKHGVRLAMRLHRRGLVVTFGGRKV